MVCSTARRAVAGTVITTVIGTVISTVVLVGCAAQVDKSGGAEVPETLVLTGINNRTLGEIAPFDEQVAALSGGSMSFEWDNGWHKESMTGEIDAITAVREGTADFAVVPARAWHNAGVTSFDALIAPMALDSYAFQDAVLRDPIVDQMLAGTDSIGLTGIGILPGPLRRPGGISRELRTPGDLQGARIAMSPGGVPERSLRELGAIPVPTSFEGTDISGADGMEGQLGLVGGSVYDDDVKEMAANVNLWPRLLVVVGSAAAVARLSDEQIEILRAAARAAVPATTQAQHGADAEGLQAICRRAQLAFIPETTAQVQQWRTAFQPVYDWLAEDAGTAKFLTRIEQLRATVGTADDPPPSCPAEQQDSPSAVPSSSESEASTSIDGVYQMTSTMQDAIDMGLPIDENIKANIGTFTWTFDRGQLTETQANGPTETWANATYEVVGDTLTVSYQGGGGRGPESSAQRKRDEVDVWIWSLYRDQLTIHWKANPAADPAIYPSNYAVKPWSRIGDVPAATPTTGH